MMNYIFLDKIQLVSEFPRVVDSLFIKENTDIDITTLEDILRFLFDNIGNTCSFKRISDTLTSSGKKVTNALKFLNETPYENQPY